ncbi:Pr6Pr family membrane protein [Arthrobacter sp. PsM3]|uniref:Pr6Pr family membrane protein n=1 Tax=Arthrobacter sp. PsM3 TaxID=3030531 RepID=UPI00263ACDDD|nr:Pr6Pr family membrane protein [Arthrobacter sp. PsM3]MDN4645392.1 Pr6Pr family membrane protein [Arthrobacter sp. PsM3]
MSGLSVLDPPVERHPGFNDALHPDRIWIRALRLVVGVFVLAALVRKTYDATLPGNDVDVAQLYSEFTVQSNLVLGLVLVASAALPRTRLPEWWDRLFGALALYLVMTGLIYVILVAPPGEPWWSLDMYWPQLVHHRVAPLFAALDWLLVTRTVRGTWRRPIVWLAYPAAFLVFSWVRGAIDGWYVYDFLDPTLGGWPAALTTTAQVLVAFLIVAVLLHVAGNARSALAVRHGR